ncbi:biorientation of chromosomes in cell division protein 1-like 1 isoform X2 [Nilaparvata lugens]|uniref:biorientation of chromosomes in cell division protein 1-like 1 isoform X2 n=1 Tax=Nilaparvata lugens TaxID=108931 RepID=UPI00193EB5D4|nr:biorientation of chromosomes in cell division protein 1-like 1 isoform X2 [Nilaparvata lugens]
MDFELYHKYPPGDPTLVEKIVCHLKAQGIFDNFRKECLSDVDTKPAYQNLRQRVDGSVAGYLSAYKWRPDLNKNQLRENLRKYIQNGGFLEVGVERIVDQVVNPKIGQVFLPKVREVVLEGLGLKKDRDRNSSDRPASCSYMPSSTFTSASIPNQTDDSKGTVELDKELVSSNESEVKKEDNGSENVVHSEEVVTSQVDSEPECVIEEAVIPLDNLNETQSNDSYESHISGMSDLTSVKSNNSCDDDDDDNPLNTDAEKEREHDADNIAGSMTSVNGGGDNSQNESNMLSNVNYEGAFSDFSFSTEFTTHVENIEIETGQIGTTEVECVTTENNEEDNDRMSPNVITESIQPNYDSDSNGKYEESQQLTEIEYDSVSDKGDEDEDENVYDESSRGLNSDHKEESHFEESQSETDVERLDSTSNEIKFSENTNYFDDSKLEKSSEDESYNRSSHDENEELEKEITYKKDKERKHHSKHKHTKNHHSNSSSGESREDRKHRKSSHSKDKHRHNRDFDKHGSNGEDKSRRTDSKHRRSRGCEVEEQEEATSTYIQEETSRSGSDKKSKYSEKVSRRSHKSRYSHSRDYEDVIAGSYEEEDDETNEYQEKVKYSRKDKKSKDRRKTSREKIYDSEFEETAFDHEEASRSESDENKVYKETLNYSQEENYTRTRDSKKVLEEEYEYGEITTDHGEESRCESEEEIRYKEKDKFSHKQKHIRSRDRKKANEDHYKYEGMSSDQEEANKSESEEINVYKKKVKYSHGEKHTRSKDRKKSSKKETLEYRNEISKFDHEEQSKSESDEKNVYKEKNKYSYEEPHCRSRVRRKTFKEDFVYGEITSDHEESSRSESDEKDVLKANIRFSHEEKLTRSRDYKKATEDEEQDFEYEESKFDKSEFDDEENEYEEGIRTKKERSSRSRRHKSAADKKLDEDDQEETKRDRKEKRRRSQKGESKEDSHSDQYEKAIFDQHEPNESEIDEKNNYQEDNSHKERHSRSRDHKNVFKEKTQDGSHKQKREGQSHHRSDSDKEKHYSSSRSKHSTSEDDVKKGKSHKSSSSFGEHKSSHHRSSRDKHATKESENYDLEEKHRIKDDKVRKDKGSSRKKRESCKPADKSREHRRSADRDRDSSGAGESRSQVGAGAVAGVSHNSNTKQTRSTGKGSKNSSTSDATQLQQSQLFSTNINQGECVEAVVQPSFSTLDSLMNDSRIHLADNVVVTANEIVSESEENTQICQEKTEDEAGGKTEDEAGGKTEDEAGGKTEDEAGGKTEDEVGGKTEDVDSKEQNKHNREVHEMSTGDIGKKNTEEESQASKSKLFQLDDLNPSIINPAPNTQEIIRNKENYEGHEKLISDYQVVGEDIVVLGNNSDVQQDEESNRLQGNEGINPDHQNLETVVSTQNIETQLPKDDQKKFRKKRFAANIAEVRKIMRERRRNEKIQKKRSSVEDSAANDHPSITDPSIDNQTQMQKHDIDEIETTVESNKDISVPDLTESSFENSAGCIQGTSCNNDVLPLPQNELNNFKYKRPKFAANIYEVRKIIKATVVANSNESETIDSTIDMTSAGSCDLNELENFILEKLESISKAIDVEISNESETIDSTYDTSDSGSKPGDSNELDAILTLEKSEAKSEVIDVKNSNESETIDSTVDMTSSDELPNSIDNVPDFEIATEKNGILDQTTQIYSDNNAKSIKEVENLPASVTLNEVLESSSLITLKPAAIPKLEESNSATESDLFARETSIFDFSSPLRGFDVDLSESLSTIYNRKIETYSSEGYEENVPSNDFVENENDETHTFISFDQRETEIAKEKLEKLKKCLEVYEKEYKSLKYLEKTELVTSDFLLDKQFDSYLEKECGLQVLRKDCIRLPPLNDENYYLDEEDGCYHLKNKPIDSSKVRKENMETLVEQIEVSRPVQSSEKKSVRVKSEKKSPVKLRISIRNPNSSAIETEEIDVPYTWDVESSTDGSTARTSVDSRNSVEDVESEQPTSTHCDVESEQPTPTHCDVESEQPTPTHCDVESEQPTPTHCDVESEQPTPTHCDVSATQAQIATQALQAHVETVQPFTNQVPHLTNPKKKRSRKRSFNSTNIVTREFKIKTCPEAENNNLPSAHLNSFKITLSRNNSNLSRIITPQSPSSQSNNFSANKILNSSDAAIPSESENSFVVDKRHTSITDSVQESRCSHSPKKWFDEDLDDTDQGIETITDYLNNSFEEEADESMASKMIGEALKNLIAESGLTTRTQSPPSYQETKESARITRQQRNRNSIVEPENTVSPPKKLRNSERLSAGVKIPKRYENTDLYKPRLDSGNRRKRKADEPALDSLVDNEPRKRRLRATV